MSKAESEENAVPVCTISSSQISHLSHVSHDASKECQKVQLCWTIPQEHSSFGLSTSYLVFAQHIEDVKWPSSTAIQTVPLHDINGHCTAGGVIIQIRGEADFITHLWSSESSMVHPFLHPQSCSINPSIVAKFQLGRLHSTAPKSLCIFNWIQCPPFLPVLETIG